jgi:hypothetical protein
MLHISKLLPLLLCHRCQHLLVTVSEKRESRHVPVHHG